MDGALKDIVFPLYHEALEWIMVEIGRQTDGEPTDITDDTCIEDIILQLNDEDCPYRRILCKLRLEGKSVYDPSGLKAIEPFWKTYENLT